MINTNVKQKLSIKTQALASIVAIVLAVALPQLFHIAGKAFGLGTGLGEIFLPMHLPVIMIGIFAGPFAGTMVGAFAPVISTILTGMPVANMLPFMMIELAAYGFSAGLLRETSMPTFAKVLISQVSGRVMRSLAMLIFGFLISGSFSMEFLSIWTSVATGIVGIAIQWIVIPPVVKSLEGKIN